LVGFETREIKEADDNPLQVWLDALNFGERDLRGLLLLQGQMNRLFVEVAR